MILFVTGTDTDVGKTTMATGLLFAARRRGLRTRGIKPIESGCRREGDELVAIDANKLARAAGHAPDILYRFEPALAPDVAASESGQPFADIQTCAAHVARTPRGTGRFTLVEGAGGLLVPIAPSKLIVDLALALELPLLVVGRAGLGTINHTSMTISIAKSHGLDVCGFALSNADSTPPDRANKNAKAIVEITGSRYLGTLSTCTTDEELELSATPILEALLENAPLKWVS